MIQSFNKNQKYLSSCVVYILNIIVHYPQFNNYEDICEIFDIYIRKMVIYNSSYSSELKKDCLDMVKFFFTAEYISQIIYSFDNDEEDAYHYLAILVQFQRISNRYKMSSLSPYHYYNPTNIYRAVVELSF